MRNVLIILCLVSALSWLLLRPTPLMPSDKLTTFTRVKTPGGYYADDPRSRPLAAPQSLDGCNFPTVSDSDKVILLSADRGQGVSTVAIQSPDIAVTVATIFVQAGSDPLYVILAPGQAVIWRFVGATERVRSIVLVDSGETGVSREHVWFLPPGCVRSFSDSNSAEAQQQAGLVRKAIGRAPEIVSAGAQVSGFEIPSGVAKITNPFSFWRRLHVDPRSIFDFLGFGFQDRMQPNLKRNLDEMYPDGVVDIDPADVVASYQVSKYEVLPNLAGLIQLVRDGAIQDMGFDEFHIRRKMRFPAGLTTGGFLLLKGVSEPDGDPGQACVVSQETGRIIEKYGHRALC